MLLYYICIVPNVEMIFRHRQWEDLLNFNGFFVFAVAEPVIGLVVFAVIGPTFDWTLLVVVVDMGE